MRNLLTAEQAAERLGVQLKTIYAYVSRGVLDRTLTEDGRKSLFEPAAVAALARRGRPRQGTRPVGSVDVSIATAITAIQPERLLYRGHDVRSLSRSTFEHTAELLWTGELPERSAWPAVGDAEAAAIGGRMPRDVPAIERFALVTSALACRTPLRVDLQPTAVMRHARTLLVTLLEALPLVAAGAPRKPRSGSTRVAARLWPRLSALPATPERVACLDSALVLLADHELATSTLAARVAASTRADPYAVVLSGLGAVSGPLHGKAALALHELLLSAAATSPERAVAQVLAQRLMPGFGHPVYRGVDPRALCLLERNAPLASRDEQRVIDAVKVAGHASSQRHPNVDFALAAFAFTQRMPVGATEAIFALARTAGWIAHALEEYSEQPLRFRARALYVGTLPE